MAGAAGTSSGDFISHFNGVRIRVNGSGVLRPTLFSQDEVTTSVLPTITMAASNRFSPFVLANVTEERVILQLHSLIMGCGQNQHGAGIVFSDDDKLLREFYQQLPLGVTIEDSAQGTTWRKQ